MEQGEFLRDSCVYSVSTKQHWNAPVQKAEGEGTEVRRQYCLLPGSHPSVMHKIST